MVDKCNNAVALKNKYWMERDLWSDKYNWLLLETDKVKSDLDKYESVLLRNCALQSLQRFPQM